MKNYSYLLIVSIFLFPPFEDVFAQKFEGNVERSYTLADTSTISSYLNKGGAIYYHDLDSAMHYWQEAINIAEFLTNSINEKSNEDDKVAIKKYYSSGLCNMALLQGALGNNQIALDLSEKALALVAEIDYKQGIATCLNNFGYIYYNLGDYQKSLDYYQQSLTISQQIGYDYLVAYLLSNIGNIYYYIGEVDKCIENYEKSISVRERLNDTRGLAQTLVSIGVAYSFKGNTSKALDYLKRSMIIIEEIGDELLLAESFNNIGFLYFTQGQLNTALDNFQQGLNLRILKKDKKGISNSYNNIGAIMEAQGDIYKAIDLYKKGLSIQEEIDDKQGMSTSLNNIGFIYDNLGEIPNAMEYYSKSLTLREELGDKSGIATSFMNIGYVNYLYGDKGKAFEYFNKARVIQEEIDDKRGLSKNFNNLGKFLVDNGDYESAMNYYLKSLEIGQTLDDKISIANSLQNIGTVYYDQKNYELALSSFKKSHDIQIEHGFKSVLPYTLFSLAHCELMANNIEVYEYYVQKAYETSKQLGYKDEIVSSASHMRDILFNKNQFEKADSFAAEILQITNKSIAINFGILSEKEQELYFSRISPRFEDYNRYAYKRKDQNPEIVGIVYNNALKTKGLMLKSSTAMRNAILKSNDSLLISNYYQWIHIKKQLAKLSAEGKADNELEEVSHEMEKELVRGSQLYNNFSREFAANWRDVQIALKKDEAAIEFVTFNISKKLVSNYPDSIFYFALVIKPNSKFPEMVKLCSEKELSSLFGLVSENNLRQVNSLYGKNDNANTQLYNLIWQPIDNLLGSAKRIYISPSGLLHKVSFSAISKKKNVYLCDLYNIDIVTSTMRVAFPEPFKIDKNMTTALFGGINYNSEYTKEEIWKYLEGTKKETNLIENLFKKNKIQTSCFYANTSTEEQFKTIADKCNIIHIATHGFFYPNPNLQEEDLKSRTEVGEVLFRGGGSHGFGLWSFVKNNNPLMRSGIVFSKANDVWNFDKRFEGEDGVLTAQEVACVDLQKTDLVVLSACETGLGDIRGGEGVYGLQRAFKMAGAKYIVMSLWQVPDNETIEFMENFYSGLLKNSDLKMAFSETQRKMRSKYDPYYWAAFVLLE